MASRSIEALYLHIPFCRGRCRYCGFLSGLYDPALADRYLRALAREADLLRASGWDPSGAITLYVGGGTPTTLEPRRLAALLGFARELTGQASLEEWTVEANPESCDRERLAVMADQGVTRVSLGVQSTDDDMLRALGRIHDAKQADRALAAIGAAGITPSVDLMYGLPGQGRESWARSLRWALDRGVPHISAYALTVEEGTPLAEAVARGSVEPPVDDRLRDLFLLARDLLGEGGLHHYEISNYALPGAECRHNLAYWRSRPYLGLGAGAHSRLPGHRGIARENPPTPDYLAALERACPEDSSLLSPLGPCEAVEEMVMMGLRTVEGVDTCHPDARTRAALGALRTSALWEALVARGAAAPGDRLLLTEEGWLISDEVAVEAFRFLEGYCGGA